MEQPCEILAFLSAFPFQPSTKSSSSSFLTPLTSSPRFRASKSISFTSRSSRSNWVATAVSEPPRDDENSDQNREGDSQGQGGSESEDNRELQKQREELDAIFGLDLTGKEGVS